MKKFFSQNMVRDDLFSDSLTVWNVRGGAAHFAPAQPKINEAKRFPLTCEFPTGGAFWTKSLPRSETKFLLLGRTFFDENPEIEF